MDVRSEEKSSYVQKRRKIYVSTNSRVECCIGSNINNFVCCISGNINLKMEVDKLKEMVGDLGYCDACFTGNYPMEVPDEDISHAFD